MLQQNDAGEWFSDLFPSRTFKIKRDAANYEKTVQLKNESSTINTDDRTLRELIELWYKLHGRTLNDGKRRYDLLHRIAEKMNNPLGRNLTDEEFAKYREGRISEVSTTTANREHSYLRAVFNELKRLGVIKYDNPLSHIRQFKEREGELRFLTHDEIRKLLSSCRQSSNQSLIYIVKICLATGARWSEAENLKASQIANGKITYLNTKNGKNRTVPISDELYEELKQLDKSGDEKMFLYSLSAFRKAIERVQIHLPKGQMSHVLRHSFASHFVMNGGNIVVLKDILGHSTITTTMRYAHLAPDHLSDAVLLNPLVNV
ncbi:Tyrosine recombinase XerD [Vibrio ruber DSM 16370]|uniref:Tyrosine recombinase XerD n=1 Tax=Vibrio ruber (strain DSM 16370 / JCM 11486 / BCRC 17186 / CECT 7878 / LMG 23124 / VR1) TaxID=1123498 RepID=A0A1R4LUC1_VIBR1|nr:tyrosine-type recombinase/integrase [Vibrio ruber]SJN60063.1 Tyrosine recombinase XerD [Vibrio ruber DSM 16370]